MKENPPTVAPLSLLIVDSHDGARRALAALLLESGYVVRQATNGVEGLCAAREALPGLVIVDPWPFFSAGLQMVEQLRREKHTAGIPILVLTSADSRCYRSQALAAGCDSYLHKPMPPDRILSEVARILGQPIGCK